MNLLRSLLALFRRRPPARRAGATWIVTGAGARALRPGVVVVVVTRGGGR